MSNNVRTTLKWFAILGLTCLGIYVIQVAYDNATHAAPHYADVCVKSHTILISTYTGSINGVAQFSLLPSTVCDKYKEVCKWGSKYEGEKVCSPKAEEET